jgi:cullin 2
VEELRTSEPLRYYQDCFESPFLIETGDYYRQEAAHMVAELSCSEYIKRVVEKLQTARRAGSKFLHQTSVTKVRWG